MTASVITFSNQIGAGGAGIARTVAQKMRFRYYDWEVTSQAAQEAGVSPAVLAATAERVPSFIERMMARLAAGEADDTPPAVPAPRLSMLTSEDYRQFIEHVVRELGKRGDAVIVGHAGQAILASLPSVLRVLLIGSTEKRAVRVAANQGVSSEQAKTTIEQSDKQRAEFFRRTYHMDWLEASRYDIVINTDFISPDLAADMIAAAAREMP